MMIEKIICNAKTGEIIREHIDDGRPEAVDYQAEIEACKQRLAETDYVAMKIAEGAATREEYSDIIAERAALRESINDFERLTAEQKTALIG